MSIEQQPAEQSTRIICLNLPGTCFPVEAVALYQLRLQPALLVLCGQVQPQCAAARVGTGERAAAGRRSGRPGLQRDLLHRRRTLHSQRHLRDAGLLVGAAAHARAHQRHDPARPAAGPTVRHRQRQSHRAGEPRRRLCGRPRCLPREGVVAEGGRRHPAAAGAWLPRATEHDRDAGQQRQAG